jgi:hypothetical protein
MAFSNRVTTTTNQYIMPKLVDTVLNSNPLMSRLLTSGKKWRGETMKFPIKYQKNTTGTSFSGFDTFSTSAIDNRVNLAFNPKFYQMTVSLPLDEVSVNSLNSDEQILNLMDTQVQTSAQDMADDVGTLLYSDGTGNSSKDFTGLGAIVDDGTNVATYGGLSRSTYTTIAATSTASSGTLTLAKMTTLYNAITSGAQKPTLGVTTEAVFALYEQLLVPQERIVKDVALMKKAGGSMAEAGQGYTMGTGATGLYFKGFPVIADEKATSGVLFFLNEDYINWYAVPVAKEFGGPIKYSPVEIEGNDYDKQLGLGFSWSGWIKPTNQAAIIGHVYLGGDFICTNPKRQGKLTGITSI